MTKKLADLESSEIKAQAPNDSVSIPYLNSCRLDAKMLGLLSSRHFWPHCCEAECRLCSAFLNVGRSLFKIFAGLSLQTQPNRFSILDYAQP